MTRPMAPELAVDLARVLGEWPEDPHVPAADDWITEADLADWLEQEDALPTTVPLRRVLSRARREGWVLRNRQTDPETFKLTPSGDAYASSARAIAEGV